ncbi:hypothetical protein L1049_002440 [Liquidambar formosana]|uniref:Uncharacterized protein n=1 Tax=Liquidambar formosana TaxID=63359 RepID=A0AAP0R9A8_LIQFO
MVAKVLSMLCDKLKGCKRMTCDRFFRHKTLQRLICVTILGRWCSLLQSEQERTKTLLYSQPTVFIDVPIGDFPITPSRSRKDCDGEQWKFSAESDEIRFVEMRVEGLSANKTAHFSVILEIFEVAPTFLMIDIQKAAGDASEIPQGQFFEIVLFTGLAPVHWVTHWHVYSEHTPAILI